MSVVTSIILILSPIESDDTIEQINAFEYLGHNINMVKMTDNHLYGGDKYFVARVLMGSYNHFPFESFLTHIKEKVKYEDKGLVQIFVKEEPDERFRLINPFGLYEE